MVFGSFGAAAGGDAFALQAFVADGVGDQDLKRLALGRTQAVW